MYWLIPMRIGAVFVLTRLIKAAFPNMHNPVFAFIGLRYAKSSKTNHFIAFINLFSVIGIALGLMALITVASVMNGFEQQLKQRLLGIMPHIVVDTRQAKEDQITALSKIASVEAISPFIESEGVLQSKRSIQGVIIHGVDPDFMKKYSIIADNMLIGGFERLQAGQFNLIIGRALASKLELRPGDQVRMISASASVYSPVGRMPSQRLFTVAAIFDVGSQLDDKVVLMHLDDSAKLLRKRNEDASQTRLVLADAFDYLQVEQQISLPSETWRARQGPLFDAVKMEKNMMSLMLLLIISVAAFNIVSALVMVVSEKQGDIAILRTQGMRSSEILGIFLVNGLYNGLKGTLFGLIGGLLLVSQINPLLNLIDSPLVMAGNGGGLPIDVQWQQIASLVGLSMSLCFFATLYPAYRALKVEPALALKYE